MGYNQRRKDESARTKSQRRWSEVEKRTNTLILRIPNEKTSLGSLRVRPTWKKKFWGWGGGGGGVCGLRDRYRSPARTGRTPKRTNQKSFPARQRLFSRGGWRTDEAGRNRSRRKGQERGKLVIENRPEEKIQKEKGKRKKRLQEALTK